MKNNLIPRPPIVVVTGHIDHGKTTLLSYIRKNKAILNESGNITQHISAYEIEVDVENEKRKITFLDTPGHEAFSSLRSRGAKIADIAILIIAADEGFKQQTKEALFHIKANNMPFIVAINKIDKKDSNPDKVKNELSQNEIFLEGRGGDVPCVEISSKDGQNIDLLLEMIVLMSDMREETANQDSFAKGYVLESNIDPKRGIVSTLIITDGTISKGDTIYTTTAESKVRILENFAGQSEPSLSFSSPALVIGFDQLPEPGSKFVAGKNIPQEEIENIKEEAKINFCKNQIIGEYKEGLEEEIINLIVKTDCVGSCEALIESLKVLAKETEAIFKIIDNSIGNVSEKDVKAAESSKAMIINFRVKVDSEVKNYIERNSLKIIEGETVYKIIEQLEQIYLSKQELKPILKARLKILATFNDSKGFKVVGGELFEGQINNKEKFEIKREDILIGTGSINGIQCQKQKVQTLGAINECGLMVNSNEEILKGDILEFYQ
ncbi:MAG: translation initiation factor IF-2 [Candidatus Methanofastidiosum sp.]|nr:translation initiation factor IF-2 [Methanofastidiosum sp.]